jgi:protein-tyrosine phosphatase
MANMAVGSAPTGAALLARVTEWVQRCYPRGPRPKTRLWEAVEVIRRVAFEGALNFRDIGGYPALAASQTRWGAVYRSDSLHSLTPDDLRVFDALGIKAIYDLRRTEELTQHPGPRKHIHLELPNRNPLDQEESVQLRTRVDGERWLLADYREMLANAAAVFGGLFSRLADCERLPAVIHCLGGKDRTGLTIALLLTALGVPREVVLDDYQLKNDYGACLIGPRSWSCSLQAALPAKRPKRCWARRDG